MTVPKHNMVGKDAGDILKEAIESMKEESTLGLAKYTSRAAKKAATHPDPLKISRNVREVASVYETLWPAEEQTGLIEGAILIGMAEVKDAPMEVTDADIREELPDKRPAGD